MKRFLAALLAGFALWPSVVAAENPTLDAARLDVYHLDGEANSLGFYAYPYDKVRKLKGKVKGVKGRFSFKDVSPDNGAPYRTYSGCRNSEQLRKGQREAFVKLVGKQVRIKFTWRYKGAKQKSSVKVSVAGAEGNGPTCAALED